LEGFYYPHGLALAVTARVVGLLTLNHAIRLAYAIKNGQEKFPLEGDKPRGKRKLERLADEAFSWLRDSLSGDIKPGKRGEVFTVFTVVRAEPMTEYQAGGDVHRLLQAVTEWPPVPETASLRPAAEIEVSTRGSDAPGSMLFARPRGRAVWLPGLFANNPLKRPSLSCYHHNLVFGCMQVDSLGGLTKETLNLVHKTGLANLDPTLKSCARNAIDRLDELHEGNRNRSYRSSSVSKQINQNERKQLEELRALMRPGQKIPSQSEPGGPPKSSKAAVN